LGKSLDTEAGSGLVPIKQGKAALDKLVEPRAVEHPGMEGFALGQGARGRGERKNAEPRELALGGSGMAGLAPTAWGIDPDPDCFVLVTPVSDFFTNQGMHVRRYLTPVHGYRVKTLAGATDINAHKDVGHPSSGSGIRHAQDHPQFRPGQVLALGGIPVNFGGSLLPGAATPWVSS